MDQAQVYPMNNQTQQNPSNQQQYQNQNQNQQLLQNQNQNFGVQGGMAGFGQQQNNTQNNQNKRRDFNVPPAGYIVPRYEREPLPENSELDNNLGGAYQEYLHCCGNCCGSLKPIICCLPVDYPYKQIDQSFVGIYERFGVYIKTVQPGLVYFNPCTDKIHVIDIKSQTIDCPQQQVLTKDNIMVTMDAIVIYRVVVPRKSKYCIDNIKQAVSHITLATIKCIAGTHTLQELLGSGQKISQDIQEFVDQHVWEWGIDIESLRIKKIDLNADLQNSLSMAAKEQRAAQAKIISAKADVESAKLMREAAAFLDSKAAMQIRYLETVSILGRQTSTKVVFMPEDAQ